MLSDCAEQPSLSCHYNYSCSDRSYRVSSLAGVSHSQPFQTSALNPGTPHPAPLKPRVPPIANPKRFILLPSWGVKALRFSLFLFR